MTEDVQQPEPEETIKPLDELQMLKARADKLGIKYSNNISVGKLKEKINESIGVTEEEDESQEELVAKAQTREELYREATKLIRLRITNMNPMKKDMPGEFFTVANGLIGTVKKFVPYGAASEEGWHVPNVIYKMMKRRTFTVSVQQRDDKGRPFMVQRERKEFALEVLPPLTQKELDKLAQDQRASGRV